MKREFIGSFFTDVAGVLVGDPCKLLKDSRDRSAPFTYDEAMEAWPPMDAPPAQHVNLGDDRGLAVRTVENCDGWCHVFMERNTKGQAVRLIVDLNTKISSTPE